MKSGLLDPSKPYLILDENEPDGRGGIVPARTIFLTASTCPIGCEMCDLYQNTLAGPTPSGAITAQLEYAFIDLCDASPDLNLAPSPDTPKTKPPEQGWIKLYNSGNFFDPQSIPPDEYSAIASLCADFTRVVVENHPRFGFERLKLFRDLLSAPLEVAVGLETVQPRWLDRLGKKMSRDQFDSYAKRLQVENVDLRVFLILGVPGISVAESLRWARLSVKHAVAQGARHVSLIPARFGNGWRGQGGSLPNFSLDDLIEAQAIAIRDADGAAVVTVDLWDQNKREPGYQTLQQMILSQCVPS